jgi:hypothetical protein
MIAIAPLSSRAAEVALYDATATLAERSEAAQATAITDALRQVAVRVTGRRAAATDPALAGFFGNAARYVKTWRPAGTAQITVSFDGGAIEGALSAAGQPLWGSDRPTTLVVLASDVAGQPRQLLTAANAGEARRQLERVAEARGLVLVWPAEPADQSGARAEDVVAGRMPPLQALAQRYGAGGLLIGRVGAPGTAPAPGAWTLGYENSTEPVRGALPDALQSLADRYASRYALAGGGLAPELITISGVDGLQAYATVLGYLESLPQIRNLSVEAANGDQLRLRLTFRGGREALEHLLVGGGRLATEEPGIDGLPRFRYQTAATL